GLNNLYDITLTKRYATICGYTQNDVETVFSKHLEGQDFAKIAKWYNGYKWLGEGVYNPFDILLFIANGFSYDNYWFSTATPTFLLKLIEKNNYYLPNLEYSIKDKKMLDSFDVDYMEVETLMWQTGYLTIVDSVETPRGVKYTLSIPNQEVRVSLLGSVADFISKIHNSVQLQDNLYEALVEGSIAKLQTHLISLYASIPYNLFTKNKMYEYEGYYVSVFYSYIKSLGIEVIGEDVTSRGRIDMTIKMDKAIYVIEFKVDGKENALAQIKDKAYHEKYLADNLPIYLVGIEFDKSERNIVKMEWEER
ncbi:MAG: PD-(D/E)XK nuclease domain-containing protein, partial [Campylobacterota bacterium]|nr:PD-(D/E)XK nuclease domain-containing protein [Campylobacterota bacterium]